MCLRFHLMFTTLVVLLAARAAQARHVHVQDSEYADSRALYEDSREEISLGQRGTSLNPEVPALLQRCLADLACSDALAAVATKAAAAWKQQQPKPHAVTGGEFLGLSAAAKAGAQQQQQPQSDRSGDAAAGGSSPLRSGDDLGWAGAEGSGEGSGGGMWVDRRGGGIATGHGLHGGDEDDPTSLSLKGLAALVLFGEAVAGMYLPLLLQRLQSPQWWMSLLNCFSGGIFLAAGIIHMLPHCAEAQEALGPIGPNGDYPLYLVLVVVGYCVVFYVERVLFDVHGEGHAHCQHSNVFSHSSYYKAISHRHQRVSRLPSGTAAVAAAACAVGQDLLALPASAHTGSSATPGAEAAVARLTALPPHPSPHQQHQYGPPPQSQLQAEGCGGNGGASGACQTYKSEGDAGAAAGGHSHSHSHLHSHQHGSHGNHGGRAPMSASAEGLFLAAGVSVALPVAAGARGAALDDDADSCHSDHSPRAVCVCVEEKEAEAEAEARAQRGSGQLLPSSQTHQHNRNQNHQHGYAHGHGRRGSAGGRRPYGAGGGSVDDLRVPLLADRAGSTPQAPTPPTLEDVSAAGDGAAAPGNGTAAPGGDDLRALAWQHLHQQQQPQVLPPQPAHQADSCAYHTHHHPHPHHRYRRRSAGAGPLGTTGGGGTPGSDSRPSSTCTSLGGHTDLVCHQCHGHHHHSHPAQLHDHNRPHHHHHHHVIKPQFRFMHGVVLLAALALHTALECIALGLIDSRPQFLLLFAAIASHKAVSALALSSRFLREGATLGQVTAYVGPFCLVAPASILAGVYVGRVAPLARLVFSCFATGTFLYVGASEVIMEEFEGEMRADRRDISTRAARYMKFLAVLTAVALVAASGLLPEPDHH